MGIADSPLRDRVIFIQGAPRSGTTWLATVLASHPQIAGIEAETHLFTRGINAAFDNFDGPEPWLSPYFESRAQFLDLARDFCDGPLLAMRVRVDGEPEFVVEKTPSSADPGALDLARKRECYPDAWYVHVLRDGEAVIRSLMQSPWRSDRSRKESERVWKQAVESTRNALGDLPRYREVAYERFVEDPAAEAAALFRWLGVDEGPEVLDRVRAVSRERYSERGTVRPPAVNLFSPRALSESAVRLARAVPRRARRLASRPRRVYVSDGVELAMAFPPALRARDADALRALTVDSLVLELRSPEGDVKATGDEARAELLRIAEELFARVHVGEWWAPTGGAPEWSATTWGLPLWTIMFSAWDGRAHRVDLAFALFVRDNLITRIVALTAGPLAGRPLS